MDPRNVRITKRDWKELNQTFSGHFCNELIIPENFAPEATILGSLDRQMVSPFYDTSASKIILKGNIGMVGRGKVQTFCLFCGWEW